MEWLGSSGMHLTPLGRIRRFFSMELPGFPSPPPETPGVRVFCAWGPWKSNVCGAVVAGIGAAVLFAFMGGMLLWQGQGWKARLWGTGMILFAVTAVWVLFAGNAAAMYPYAVEIDEGKGFCFYAPFKKFYMPIQEVKRVRWSWLLAGWVVSLKRRRVLLSCFVIHVAWGRQGRELAQAIREELARIA